MELLMQASEFAVNLDRMIHWRFDARSLALFRAALGILALSQAIVFGHDFDAFFRTDGFLSLETIDSSRIGFLSPQALTFWLRVLIFDLLPISASALILGFFTPVATFGCFICLIVVQGANPDILQGGDVLLRVLLFWSLFLPLGEIWSLDCRFQWMLRLFLPWTIALATWALTFQICFVYWFAALLKSDPLWTQNGNALFYALNIEHFTAPLGLYLRQFPELLRIFTFGTLGLEFVGPCLLLIPWQRDRLRLFAVILFVGFHLIGMHSLLRIGLFPWVCAAAWLIFIPGFAWDWLRVKRAMPTSLVRDKVKFKRTAFQQKGYSNGPQERPSLDFGCGALVIAAFLDVLAWNVASVRGTDAMQWMNQYDIVGKTFRLDQRWNMYAPFPTRDHGWLVIPAELADGSEVDLFNGKPVSWEKPDDIGAYFGDDRWRRYLANLFDNQDPQSLQAYADYLVCRWNQHVKPGEEVQAVTIYYMRQVTQPDLTITSPEKDAIYFRSY